ncbi:Putative phosphoglycolate phosphatase-like, domain 2, HAD superfamily [Colletotrichum destructivum]|uniref:Phosphoglycolate phosphatase-like, domain 2, HAD superfamily n=1 Tax=Colletotrichum destructivum TaxID=34406 RepID=A0AAX4HZ25_9PEZI|nr:Putative phosphoglycolate phosphatase-like, domain 2, HAD superfamily [Colletotrichum destructivum]
MASHEKDFPAIRACIFDMDGLLINSEDIITLSTNRVLEKHGRPAFTQSIRAQLMGVPDSTNGDVFHNWAKLPPLSGAEKMLFNLSRARSASSGERIQLALASSTKTDTYKLKTYRPETKRLLDNFQADRRILGDDPRVRQGRGKPAPDIYLLALESINSVACSGQRPIQPNECLVFEDSVAGVEAGSRTGMRVVWVPHQDVAAEYEAREKDVLAARSGMFGLGDDGQLGETDDGWAESMSSLEHFDYKKYGINMPS